MRRRDSIGAATLAAMAWSCDAKVGSDASAPAADTAAGAQVEPAPAAEQPSPPEQPGEADVYRDERQKMVTEQLAARDIDDPRVLQAMGDVPRHEFVDPAMQRDAYRDHPLPIGHEVTISQPYVVALMTQLAEVQRGERVLDVGTGSGYQAAVLSELGAHVYGIEIVEPLAKDAAQRLDRLGYDEVEVRAGDGYAGWPEHAPFHAIIVAAAAPKVPEPLKEQLAVGGRLVIPVGGRFGQMLQVIERTEDDDYVVRSSVPVAFVPMTGEVRN